MGEFIQKPNVTNADKIEAGYLAGLSNRSAAFWEAWMMNEDPSVVGNNPLNIMSGGSSFPDSIQKTMQARQSNGAYVFDTPQDGAIATVYWLQHEGYADILNASNDPNAIATIAKKTPNGYFMGATNQAEADKYANDIRKVYEGITQTGVPPINEENLTGGSGSDWNQKYTGLAGTFEWVDHFENAGGLYGFGTILHRLPIILIGLGIIVFTFASIALKKAEPFAPLIAEAMV